MQTVGALSTCVCVHADAQLRAAQVGGLWLIGAVSDASSAACACVCGQCAREPGEGEQFLLPAVDSSGTAEARVKNCSLEPTLRSCFLSSRPLLLVLLSSETGEFPSFIYIITLKVFIDCD